MVKIKCVNKHQPEGMVIEVDDIKAKELVNSGMYIYEGKITKKVDKNFENQVKQSLDDANSDNVIER